MTAPSAFAAVVGAELRLRLRNPSFPLLIAAVVSASALLVPAPDAAYTTVTVNGHRLLMSADTSLVAASVVLGIVLFPICALALDAGHVRDGELGVDRLLLTTPGDGRVVAGGRLVANLLAVLGIIMLALLVLSSTIGARSLGAPSVPAMAVFLLIVGPVGIAAVALGALLDRYLGRWSARRTIAAFVIWFAAMLAAALGGRDLFGAGYLRSAIVPGGHPASMSVGAVSTRGLASEAWTSAPLTTDLVGSRVLLAAVLGALVAATGMVIRARLQVAQPQGGARIDVSTAIALRPANASTTPAAMHARASTSGRAGVANTSLIVLGRWLSRSRVVVGLLLLTLYLATRGGSGTTAAIAAALLIPAAILSKTSRGEALVAATLEPTTSALVRPTSALSYCWMLAGLALLPAMPALLRLGAMQAATAVCGLLATTMWLAWAHRGARRPVLGTAVFSVLWYLSVFNHPPARMDLFGLWGASPYALAASMLAVALAFRGVSR